MECAPETWNGESYDEKADVYSFGAILWKLFAAIDGDYDKIFERKKQRDSIQKVCLVY